MGLVQLRDEVVRIAKEAGAFIRREAEQFDRKRIEFKGLHDMVSYVDKQAEAVLVEQLIQVLPDAGFITEENTSSISGRDYTWIIDPLDGTTNFNHGNPTYAVSIALEQAGELLIGVVYEVNRDECFYASKGGGAFLNGRPLKVSTAASLHDSLLATGFPYYDFEKQDAYLEAMRELMQKTRGLRRIGSAAIDLAYVAAGRFDAYFEYNLNAYDIAAGILLVREAGGYTSDFRGGGEMFERREILASNPTIAGEMADIIARHFGTRK